MFSKNKMILKTTLIFFSYMYLFSFPNRSEVWVFYQSHLC